MHSKEDEEPKPYAIMAEVAFGLAPENDITEVEKAAEAWHQRGFLRGYNAGWEAAAAHLHELGYKEAADALDIKLTDA